MARSRTHTSAAAAIAGAVLLGLVSVAPAAPAAADTPPSWSTAPIGGGGFVTGLVVGPGDRLYARTDVGGAYRKDRGSDAWTLLTTSDRVTEPEGADHRVASIAVAPSDADTVYLAVGDSNKSGRGRVLASHDGGRSFVGSTQRWSFNGNDKHRQAGERLAVDPGDPNTVWLGTQDSLWRSVDGGTSWSQLTSMPSENGPGDPGGTTAVVVDPSSRTDGAGRRLGVWAGVRGVGVVRTDDGGATWRTVVPHNAVIHDMELDANGDLVVVAPWRKPSQLVRIAGDEVTDVAVPGDETLRDVAVDPNDPRRMFVASSAIKDERLWRTVDGGATWKTLKISISSPREAWPERTTLDRWMSVGEIVFDSTSRLWFAEGMGVWRAEDLADDDVTWTFDSTGIEELVSNHVVKVPGGPLVTAHWDRGLFVHGNQPLPILPQFNSAWSIATTPADRNVLAAVIDNQQKAHWKPSDVPEGDRQSVISADGGRTWQRMASLRNGTHPDELRFGNIAISSTDPRHLVWAPARDGRIHWSGDGGATWTAASINPDPSYFDNHYLHRHVLVADPVRGATFYVLSEKGVWRTDDGGRTWNLPPNQGIPRWHKIYNAHLVAVPGRSGELFMSSGQLSGSTEQALHTSVDGGASWSPVAAAPDAGPVAFGAPALPGGPPVLWVESRDDAGRRVIRRSVDLGASFSDVGTHPLGRYDKLVTMAGDPEDAGTVYLGYAGTGFIVGRIGGSAADPLVITEPSEHLGAFVRALHADFLDRPATEGEVAGRVGELATGRSRSDVVRAFAGSEEWVRALVDGYYRSTLGRSADAGGRAHWTTVIRNGAAPASVAAGFYASDEYHRRVGGTDAAWIADLYGELLHRPADPAGASYWVDRLAAGSPRADVALAFYQSLESRRTRVAGLYQALLGRDPESTGRAHWAAVLADGHDLRLAVHLASSDEYLSRAVHRFS